MKHGRVEEQGPFAELMGREGELATMMQNYGGMEHWLDEEEEAADAAEEAPDSPQWPKIVGDLSSVQYPPPDNDSDDGDSDVLTEADGEGASGIEVLGREYDGDGTVHLQVWLSPRRRQVPNGGAGGGGGRTSWGAICSRCWSNACQQSNSSDEDRDAIRGTVAYHRRKVLDQDKIDVDKCGSPPSHQIFLQF